MAHGKRLTAIVTWNSGNRTAKQSGQGEACGKNIIMSRAFPFVRIREEEWCARREISGPMGVLAFGDSSTWAIKDYEDHTHVKKLAKASHKPFEEREKEKMRARLEAMAARRGIDASNRVVQAAGRFDVDRPPSLGSSPPSGRRQPREP